MLLRYPPLNGSYAAVSVIVRRMQNVRAAGIRGELGAPKDGFLIQVGGKSRPNAEGCSCLILSQLVRPRGRIWALDQGCFGALTDTATPIAIGWSPLSETGQQRRSPLVIRGSRNSRLGVTKTSLRPHWSDSLSGVQGDGIENGWYAGRAIKTSRSIVQWGLSLSEGCESNGV